MDLTGLGSVATFAKTIVERIWPPKMSEEEKAKATLQLQEILQERETALLEAQKSIIVTELQQGDNYTKRARPTIVYSGLAFIFLVHVFLPVVAFLTNKPVPQLTLPSEFWWAWSGVCGVWILGRTAEKVKGPSKLIKTITGG